MIRRKSAPVSTTTSLALLVPLEVVGQRLRRVRVRGAVAEKDVVVARGPLAGEHRGRRHAWFERAVEARAGYPARPPQPLGYDLEPFDESLLEGIPHARVERPKNAGHFPMLDDPDYFMETVKEFLDGEPAGE